MGMAGKGARDKQREKNGSSLESKNFLKNKNSLKSKNAPKYGQVKLRHSRMGVFSCFLGAGSLILLFICILSAFVMREKTFGFVGGLGFLCFLPAVLGVRASIKGLRERDKRYVTCRAGLAGNIVLLLVLVFIFIGGI